MRRLVDAVGMDGASLQALCSGVHGATAFWEGAAGAEVEVEVTGADGAGGAAAGAGAVGGGEL